MGCGGMCAGRVNGVRMSSLVEYEDAVRLAAACRASMDGLGWGRNECFIGTRASIEVCKRLGWRSRPLTVAAFLTKMDAKIASGTNASGALTFSSTDTTQDDGLFDTAWDGHLLTLVANRWLVDVTADQFSRPEHGLTLNNPIILEVDEYPVRPGSQYAGHEPDTGLVIVYKVVDDDTYWTRPYWQEQDHWMPVAEHAHTLLKEDGYGL